MSSVMPSSSWSRRARRSMSGTWPGASVWPKIQAPKILTQHRRRVEREPGYVRMGQKQQPRGDEGQQAPGDDATRHEARQQEQRRQHREARRRDRRHCGSRPPCARRRGMQSPARSSGTSTGTLRCAAGRRRRSMARWVMDFQPGSPQSPGGSESSPSSPGGWKGRLLSRPGG